jgi:hypothetical protein
MPKKQMKKATNRTTVVVEKPRRKKAKARAKPAPELTVEKLRELAVTHKPPQSWYEEDLDGI